MKKILLFLMFLILSLTSLAERFVVSSKDGYANLRKEATTNSKVIMKVDNSTQITLLFKNGDWYYVEIFKNNPLLYAEGYIHKSQLELHPETYVVFSKDGYANLRRGTTINSEILDVLDNGEYVTKLDEADKPTEQVVSEQSEQSEQQPGDNAENPPSADGETENQNQGEQ